MKKFDYDAPALNRPKVPDKQWLNEALKDVVGRVGKAKEPKESREELINFTP